MSNEVHLQNQAFSLFLDFFRFPILLLVFCQFLVPDLAHEVKEGLVVGRKKVRNIYNIKKANFIHTQNTQRNSGRGEERVKGNTRKRARGEAGARCEAREEARARGEARAMEEAKGT